MSSITLQVKARPSARIASLVERSDGTWEARLTSPPVDGKANAELVALVARHFGCPKSAVSIRRGVASRHKVVHIAR